MFFKKHSFFKSSDARGFFFFLLLTSLVAVLIKLSKEYTETYSVPITITEVPINKTVQSIKPSEIEFSTTLSGFSLLKNSLATQELAIKFSSLDSISEAIYNYDTRGLSTLLKKTVAGAKEFSNYKSSTIVVDVDVLATKKMPVLADVQIEFTNGYNTYASASITPDSVTVVGPLGILKQLQEIHTKSQSIDEVTNDVKLELAIDTLSIYKELRFSDTHFVFAQQVAKYTEGSFSIPVTVRGEREETIKIFPREVTLFFVASLEEYDAVLATDFEVVADFSTRNNEDEYVVLSILRKPDNVRNVRLQTKQIKFIVVN